MHVHISATMWQHTVVTLPQVVILVAYLYQLCESTAQEVGGIFVSASCHRRHRGTHEKISTKFQSAAAAAVIRFVVSLERVGRRMCLSLFHLIILLGNLFIPLGSLSIVLFFPM